MSTNINLNDYLNKPIECNCGKTHSIAVKLIDIGVGAKDRIGEDIKKLGYHNVFMVSDVNTYEAAGKYAEKSIVESGLGFKQYIYPDKDLIPNELAIGRIMQRITKDIDLIVAVGSGTLNDICKFTSHQLGLDYIVFASAPSMDGFVSVGAALVTDFVKTTYDAHVPVAVIGDTDILADAPMDMILAGLGDILGKYTCLLDWKVANLLEGEYICDTIIGYVKNAIKVCVEHGPKLKDRDKVAVQSVMEALVLSGMCMSFVGNSRPASGSEHHQSHYWEMQFQMMDKKPILHGIKVGVGMISSISMYQRLIKEKPDFEALKNVKFDYDAWEKKVKECYIDAAPGIIALEKKCQKNSIEKRNERLDIIKNNWDKLVSLVNEELPPLHDMEKLMSDLGAPINPSQIGVSSTLVHDAIVLAKEVRNRFTILQVLWDLNLLESYANQNVEYFENGQESYINSLKKKNQDKLAKIKLFVLDMDGTIYLDNELFSYTPSFLKKVKESGKEYCFYTNNSSKNQNDYLTKLKNMNIQVTPDKMLLSTQVIIEYLLNNHKDATYYIVGTQSLKDAFSEAGLKVVDENPDVVIVGFDTTLNYEKLDKACHYIRNGAIYYGVNPDWNCPMKNKTYIPDCGSIAKLIEASTGRFPEFFGKPSKYTLDYVIRHTGYKEEEIAFIGDRIYTDIAVASGTKATSIMVLSGESTIDDIDKYGITPDLVVDSLESLIEYL